MVQNAIGLDVELLVMQGRLVVIELAQGRADGIEAGLAGGDGRVEFWILFFGLIARARGQTHVRYISVGAGEKDTQVR